MKKYTTKLFIFSAVACMGVAIASIAGMIDLPAILECIFGGSGGGMLFASAGPGVIVTDAPQEAPNVPTSATTATTANLEDADLLEQDLDKDITLFSPDRYPLDTITRNYARTKRKAGAQKIGYPQIGYKPLTDHLDVSAGAVVSSSFSAPTSSFDGSKEITKVYVKPLNIDIWRNHDTLLMRGLKVKGNSKDDLIFNGSQEFEHDQMFWVSKKEGEVLELTPIGGMKGTGANSNKFVVPPFGEGGDPVMLVRMGQAKHELAMQTDPYAMLPEIYEQYCQNFMAQIEESTFAMLTTTKKVKIGFSDFEADNISSMRAEMEASFLWSDIGEIRDGNNPVLFTGGICRNIDNVLYYGTEDGAYTLTPEDYTTWLETVFTGNNGSKERVLLAGAKLLSAISLLRESEKSISGSHGEETYLGVRVTKIVHELGTVRVVHAPLFDETGWGDRGVILDIEHLSKRDFIKLHAKEIDLVGSGQKNAKAKVLQEVSCMVLRYPDCHALIRPIEKNS
uniref:SU10 major capsid protein n=1 Tax=Alistipes sp. TaxID=1872444 RepID=UPI0040573F02